MKKKEKPYYRNVYDSLKKSILSGDYKVGDFLPTEQQLCEYFNVSKITIRRAISMLVLDSLIQVKQGSGTTVLHNNSINGEYRRFLNISSITEMILEGDSEKTYTVKGMHIDEIQASFEVAKMLEVPIETKIYKMQRIICVNGKPFSLMTNYLKKELVPNLHRHQGHFVNLYKFLEEEYDIIYTSSKEYLVATSADLIDSKLLEVEIGAPLLYCERIAQCNVGILEFATTKFCSDQYKLCFEMKGFHA